MQPPKTTSSQARPHASQQSAFDPHALIPQSVIAGDQPSVEAPPRRFLRIRAVRERTGLSTSTIYRYVEKHQFPAPFRLGPNAAGGPVGWAEDHVQAWCASRPQAGGRDRG